LTITQALAGLLLLSPAFGGVAHDGSNSENLIGCIAKQRDTEFHQDPRPVLPDGGHGEQLRPVPGHACLHDLPERVPVPGTELFRDDEIQALANRFRGRVPEDRPGAGVPQADDPLAVGHDDGVRGIFYDLAVQPSRFLRCHSPRPSLMASPPRPG
jgi:hypothetical protein